MKICIVGPAHPLRGGLASFNERLATQFQNEGHDVQIITFKLQYPNLLFPGKTQYSNAPKPEHLKIDVALNSISPLNWIQTSKKIRSLKPDLVIIRYWTPFMAPCLGTLARLIQKRNQTKVICLVDNLIPHEKHFFDSFLTSYFVKGVDGFVTMSQSVYDDVANLKTNKPIKLTPHPMFDNFGLPVAKEEALDRLNLNPNFKYLLYFGLIRHYKGLDLLIEAFGNEKLRSFPYKLIIAGEFYEDPTPYYELIKKNNIGDHIELRTEFIPNHLVADYFSVADLVALPYKDATQSGVTQIAYHFKKPMLVTNVGGLPEIVINGVSGYVVEPKVEAISEKLIEFCTQENPNLFEKGIEIERKRFEWKKMTEIFYSF